MAFTWPEITERERRALPGKFRAVAVDTYVGATYYLIGDFDTSEAAIEHEESAFENRMAFTVADSEGNIVYPINPKSTYRIPD
jgi:hypothetical protein